MERQAGKIDEQISEEIAGRGLPASCIHRSTIEHFCHSVDCSAIQQSH